MLEKQGGQQQQPLNVPPPIDPLALGLGNSLLESGASSLLGESLLNAFGGNNMMLTGDRRIGTGTGGGGSPDLDYDLAFDHSPSNTKRDKSSALNSLDLSNELEDLTGDLARDIMALERLSQGLDDYDIDSSHRNAHKNSNNKKGLDFENLVFRSSSPTRLANNNANTNNRVNEDNSNHNKNRRKLKNQASLCQIMNICDSQPSGSSPEEDVLHAEETKFMTSESKTDEMTAIDKIQSEIEDKYDPRVRHGEKTAVEIAEMIKKDKERLGTIK